ncbi:hypothetical protein M422DRAFT_244698 [Sphaerobolus stellatus SS14]|nr:hypothetical protein M422DRAFT_244698 [Sphaerobolus stellatus SS14]
MQDRYEVGVVASAKADFIILEGCTFLNTSNDPCFAQWKDDPLNHGTYATNSYALSIVQKSSVSDPTDTDLMIAGVSANFQGYYPGYSNWTSADARHGTWLQILKARSRNNAGTEFQCRRRLGLQAYEGVQLVRKAYQSLIPLGGEFTEEVPGPSIQSEQDVKNRIKNEAWGHHGSYIVPIGAVDDPAAALDSNFRLGHPFQGDKALCSRLKDGPFRKELNHTYYSTWQVGLK